MLHAGCAGLSVVPEGDWHCVHCVCAGCGHAGFGDRADLDAAASPQVPPHSSPVSVLFFNMFGV